MHQFGRTGKRTGCHSGSRYLVSFEKVGYSLSKGRLVIDDIAFELFAMQYGIGRGDKTKENPTGKTIMS